MTLLVKPEPFSQEFDRFFNTLFDTRRASSQRWVPAIDLVEVEDHFVLKADLPGLSQEDVSIEIQDGTLAISGERKSDHEQSEQGFYRVERSYGSFSRSLSLPDGVDADGVTADFADGVLTVQIPKPSERKPRRVQIGTADDKPVVEGSEAET
jgi:HSP20 family protein